MAGVFGTWQPIYAEAGLTTFPVDADAKKPAIGNPLKAGRNASAQWALKFSETNALGFACGYGGVGIWWGLALGIAVVAVLATLRFAARARLGLVPARR